MVAEMQQMREDFAVGQEEAASKLARSSRRDPYSFRRKGNENQYRFCEDVEERLETTSAAIARAERGAGREALARAKAKEKKAKEGTLPTNSEAIGEIFIQLKYSYLELCVVM